MLWLLLPLWFFLALIMPIVAAFVVAYNGSTYTFAFSISLLGIVLIFISIFTKRHIIKIKTASALKDISGRIYLGTGIIPYRVSFLLSVGFGFIGSGLIIGLLSWLGIIINKAH